MPRLHMRLAIDLSTLPPAAPRLRNCWSENCSASGSRPTTLLASGCSESRRAAMVLPGSASLGGHRIVRDFPIWRKMA